MKKNNVFVIDTNILVSAFILPNSTARKALEKAIETGQITQSQATINEFAEVFIRTKFDKYLSLETRLQIINDFTQLVSVIITNVTIAASRDDKDNKFLELAVSAQATCIISGDMDLLVLNPFNGIPIITAAHFLYQSFEQPV